MVEHLKQLILTVSDNGLWVDNSKMTIEETVMLINLFIVTLIFITSIISLIDFREEEFSDHVTKFNENSFQIRTLKELQEENSNWEEKLFELFHRVEYGCSK